MRFKRFDDFANEGEQQDKFNLGDLQDIADEMDRDGLLPGYSDREAEGEGTLRLDFGRDKSLWLHASGSVDFGGSVGAKCKKFLRDKGFVFEGRKNERSIKIGVELFEKFSPNGEALYGAQVTLLGKWFKEITGLPDASEVMKAIGSNSDILDTIEEHFGELREGSDGSGATAENSTEADALAKQVEDSLRAVFPKSNLVCRVERRMANGIVVSFTLGKGKSDYKNGIYNNDPAWLNIHAWLNDDGSVPDNIKVESRTAGRISVKASDARYAYEAVKTGWRDFTCPKDRLAAKLTTFFEKLKKTIVDNVDRMDTFDAEVARRVLDL